MRNTKFFTTLYTALPSYQVILPSALHNEVWSCVSMGNSSNSKFCHLLWGQKKLKFRGSHYHPNFPPFQLSDCQESCFFCSFSKVFTFYISEKNVIKLSAIQTFSVLRNSVQASWTTKCLFCGWVLFWRTK